MRISALLVSAIPMTVFLSCTVLHPDGAMRNAVTSITSDSLLAEIKALSSDDFEGRKPGTDGEIKTVAYMESQFRKLGLKAGNPNGTFLQTVPLAGILSKPTVEIDVQKKRIGAEFKKDYVATSSHYAPEVNVEDSDIVFVGYGVVAPEYGWDDYKDVDVTGKTLLMLVNDPQIPDPKDPSKLDETMFKGRAMTY